MSRVKEEALERGLASAVKRCEELEAANESLRKELISERKARIVAERASKRVSRD